MNSNDSALFALGRERQASNYRFTTVTPATHQRVNGRPTHVTSTRDVFGWSRPFRLGELPDRFVSLLDEAGELELDGDIAKSKVRFSTLGDELYVHSAFPTDEGDAVFFGPDTYRFARALNNSLSNLRPLRSLTVVDIGCGSGAGGLHASMFLSNRASPKLVLADVNPKALRYSKVNAALNGVPDVTTIQSDVFAGIDEDADLIISNPPYLSDDASRLYRHGGGELGLELSMRIVDESLDRLTPGGRLFLYTGTPVIDGVDQFFEAVKPRLTKAHTRFTYEEIDPDVFGEELERAPYHLVDRVAVVALTVHA